MHIQKKNLIHSERKISAIMYLVLLVFWLFVLMSKVGFERYITHFPIPLTMVAGGFISGFTICGGGAVSFPIFSKVLDMDPSVARDFSLAIQSFGMTFASITILLRKIKIEKNVVICCSFGGIIGVIMGNILIVPKISSTSMKLLFTLVIASFGIVLCLKNYIFDKSSTEGYETVQNFNVNKVAILILIGIVGGNFTAVLGTGIDIIAFSIVTLLFKIDEKVLNPTSDIIMAFISIIGFSYRVFFGGGMEVEAMLNFPLAVPVVTLMAPIGAIVASKISRMSIVNSLLFFIVLEITTTFILMKLSLNTIIASIGILIGLFLFYLALMKLSNKIDSNIS